MLRDIIVLVAFIFLFIVIIVFIKLIIIFYQFWILIEESGDKMVNKALACRHFPILDKGCPVEFDMKYLFYYLDNRLAILVCRTIDSMQKVFGKAKTMLSQGSYQFQGT